MEGSLQQYVVGNYFCYTWMPFYLSATDKHTLTHTYTLKLCVAVLIDHIKGYKIEMNICVCVCVCMKWVFFIAMPYHQYHHQYCHAVKCCICVGAAVICFSYRCVVSIFQYKFLTLVFNTCLCSGVIKYNLPYARRHISIIFLVFWFLLLVKHKHT